MKVALVSYPGPLGSVADRRTESDITQLAQALAEQDHEVVLYSRQRARAETELADGNVPDLAGVVTVPLPAGPSAATTGRQVTKHTERFTSALRDELTRHKPDVVHSHCCLGGLAALLATQETSIPVAHTFHQLRAPYLADPSERSEQGGTTGTDPARAMRAVARHADQVLAATDAERRSLIGIGTSRQRVKVIPVGIDAEHIDPEAAAEPCALSHRVVLVGSCTGAELAISALPALPDTELVLLDHSGELSRDRIAELRRLAKRLRVIHRVRVGVEPSRRTELLRSADVAVYFPAVDDDGAAPLEPMACAIPVVTCGEPSEAVVDGVTGVHLDRPSRRDFTRMLRELLGDETRRLGMGLAGRDRALRRYQWSRIAAENAHVYEELLARSAGG
jgi:D-inositol-3-phosphate glycosyltransferase